ncbi:MAG: GTP cyclohydrolase II [Alphaproteobacteria bacterium]|nr:MAG: GTP cyclohydrolase II [Alphaproteobacteria bacterium]
MALQPDMKELAARARADLRVGLPVVLREGDEAALVVSAETVTPARLAELRKIAPPFVAITPRRAETLKARAYSDLVARVRLPDEAGIDWIRALADPADDLATPMKGPFATIRGGSETIAHHAILLAKSAMLLPAAIVVPVGEAEAFARENSLTLLDLSDAPESLWASGRLEEVSSGRVPMAVSKAGRLHVFRPVDGGEEHYAVEIGRPDRHSPVLARLHSACFTGDVLGSLKCDCGPQLHAALEAMGREGAGVLLYLNQEGRGIGLANKMRAYSLQDQGFDTVEANHRLGFEDDERDFRIGSEILKALGFNAVRLMTNNPRKVAMMEAQGIAVAERVPLKVGEGDLNRAYLATKARKSGHLL